MPRTGLDANTIATVQAGVRRPLLRAFVRRGLLPGDEAQAVKISRVTSDVPEG